MFFDALFEHAIRKGQNVAIIDDHGQYTYAQVAGLAAGLAARLRAQTTKPIVGLLLPSGASFVASFYGTLLAGKAVAPINFLLGEREIAHIIADSGIDTVISAPPLASKLQNSGLKIIDVTEFASSMAKAAAQATQGGQPPALPSPANLPKPNPDDLAVLLYTSGTSGLPKGVVLSYRNLQADTVSAIEHARLVGEHKFLGIVPLFHSTGMLATLLAPIMLGAQVIYIARFSPVATVKAIAKHRISIVAAVPSMYGAIARLKDASPADFTSLYAAISGGEPLPAAIREGFQQRFGQPIYEGYGLTETIGPIAFNVPGARKAGSVGKIIPSAEVKIVGEQGEALPTGQTGEVWLRGPMVMQCYYNLPRETSEALTPEGYFKSGDLGFMDDEGYLHINGRKKDLIIVAGEKASPREIEETLMTHPSVGEAAVVGKPDPMRGEVVVAFIVPRDGQTPKPDDLRDYCRQKNLAAFKVPREVIVVSELPHTPTGKVLKRVLVEQLAQAEKAS